MADKVKTLLGKEVTELESTDKFDQGDLLLLRKTSAGVDRKISQQAFIDSLGNSALDGFEATVDNKDINKITVTALNKAKIYEYKNGMKISFISPVATNFDVMLRIESLDYVNFFNMNSDTAVNLQKDEYVEAVYVNNSFRRINNFKDASNIYSDEYTVFSTTIAEDEQSSELQLTSSIGLKKEQYYDGMAINFLCKESTKGTTKIRVDTIQNASQVLYEPTKDSDEARISLELYKDQIVRAVYSSDAGGFIRDRFSVVSPAIIANAETEEVVPYVPDSNITEEENSIREEAHDLYEEPVITDSNVFTFYISDEKKTNHYKNAYEALNDIYDKFSSIAQVSRTLNVNLIVKKELNKERIRETRLSNFQSAQRDLSFITVSGDDDKIVMHSDHWYSFGWFGCGAKGKIVKIKKGTHFIIHCYKDSDINAIGSPILVKIDQTQIEQSVFLENITVEVKPFTNDKKAYATSVAVIFLNCEAVLKNVKIVNPLGCCVKIGGYSTALSRKITIIDCDFSSVENNLIIEGYPQISASCLNTKFSTISNLESSFETTNVLTSGEFKQRLSLIKCTFVGSDRALVPVHCSKVRTLNLQVKDCNFSGHAKEQKIYCTSDSKIGNITTPYDGALEIEDKLEYSKEYTGFEQGTQIGGWEKYTYTYKQITN